MKHSYGQTAAASRCDSSGCGMKFQGIRLNYERQWGGWQQQIGPWHCPFPMGGRGLGDRWTLGLLVELGLAWIMSDSKFESFQDL